MRSTPLNISFRRALVGDKLDEWENLVAKITHIYITDERDLFIWSLHNNSQLMANVSSHDKSKYTLFSHKIDLEVKISSKIFKNFLWYLYKG